MRIGQGPGSSFATWILFGLLYVSQLIQGIEGKMGNWRYASNNPLETHYTVTVAWNGTIYMLGDSDNYEYDDLYPTYDRVWMINPETLAWKWAPTKGDLPQRHLLYCGEAYDGKMYIFGGGVIAGTQNTNDFYSLDLFDYTWTRITEAPGTIPIFPRDTMKCIGYNGFFYVFGGYSAGFKNEFWKFNFASRIWSRMSKKPVGYTPVSYTQMVRYEDVIAFVSGSDPNFNMIAGMWRYNTTSETWLPAISYADVLVPKVDGSIALIGTTIYYFGGSLNSGNFVYDNNMVSIDVVSGKVNYVHSYPSPDYKTSFPISAPSYRHWNGLSAIGSKLYVVGGISKCMQNDIWVYDTVTQEWTQSSLDYYPLGRTYPHVASVSSNKFIVFGGQICYQSIQPINDLWLYATDSDSWELLQRESVCSPSSRDCAPAVLHAAFGYYGKKLYLIGGSYPVEPTHAISLQFSFESKSWSPYRGADNILHSIGTLYSSAYVVLGSKMLMWGGSNANAPVEQQVYVVDFSSGTSSAVHSNGISPEIRRSPRGFIKENHFCFCDTSISGVFNKEREIWCYQEVSNTWGKIGKLNSSVPDMAIVGGYDVNFYTFGGYSGEGNVIPGFWIDEVESGFWSQVKDQDLSPPGRSLGEMFSLSGDIILFGGFDPNSIYMSNSVYRLTQNELWCSGIQSVTSSDVEITDGSGNYGYFSGTKCRWNISQTNFIVVDSINIGIKASLSISTVDKCDANITINEKSSTWFLLDSLGSGTVIKVPSGRAQLSFNVSSDGVPSPGFRILLFDCKKGYSVNKGGCFCDVDHFINFRDECIVCPSGSSQNLRNQRTCISSKISVLPTIDVSNTKQSEMVGLASYLPPLVKSSAAVIDSKIYVVGGQTSASFRVSSPYLPMDTVYIGEKAVDTEWIIKKASGDIPSGRTDACFIGMDTFAVLLGGSTEKQDMFVYHFDKNTNKWSKKNVNPHPVSGASCVRYSSSIYLLGGHYINGTISNSLWEYNPNSEVWVRKITNGLDVGFAYGAGVAFQNHLYAFGGWNGMNESSFLYRLNFDTLTWSGVGSVQLDSCLPCDDESGTCVFGRQKFSYGAFGPELHVFGGIRQGEVLEDVLIISLESGKIMHRENYGLDEPTLPISNPPPKHSASYAVLDSSVLIIGGSSSSNVIGNDVWTWDSELRTWSDSSIARCPVHRTTPGFSKYGNDSFIIFGGSTFYLAEVLLNDLWVFSLGAQKWENLFAGSSTVGPAPRSGAVVGIKGNKIYVFGGQTKVGVYDSSVWSFTLDLKKWEPVSNTNKLSKNQRPFNRVGIASVQLDNRAWMWGGQLAGGVSRTEFYSAAIFFDENTYETKAATIDGNTPERRLYHLMCSMSSNDLMMYGGVSFFGTTMKDAWKYSPGSGKWAPLSYAGAENPSIQQGVCGDFGDSNVIFGFDANTQQEVALMMQNKFGIQTKAHISTSVVGYGPISRHAGASFGGVMITFGGSDGSAMTNQVVAYRPGFCSPGNDIVIESGFDVNSFDDGSGPGMYLENTNCTWTLPSSNYLIVKKQIRTQDTFIISSLGSSQPLSPIESFTSESGQTTSVWNSLNGFRISFISKGTSPESNAPCFECEGFTASHAACPKDSKLDYYTQECVCLSGFKMLNQKCQSVLEDSSSINLGVIIGASLGGVIIAMVSMFLYIFKKKSIKESKAKEKHLNLIQPSELTFGALIGTGGYGQVFKGVWRGSDVALKVFTGKKMDSEQIEAFKREISIMVELRHPNIVLYMGACLQSDSLCLVCELMHQGSLYDVLHGENLIPFKQRIQFMYDISKGMQYLHMSDPPIIHRDLKSPNILVDDRNRLKVSDFGLTFVQGINHNLQNAGSLLWLAPEVIKGGDYTDKSDVYSFGIISWEILSRQEPYQDIENIFSIATQVLLDKLRPTIPPKLPNEFQQIVKDLWAHNPHERPTFQESSRRIQSMLENSRFLSNSSFAAIMNEDAIPPQGIVCVVSARIYRSGVLWDEIPGSMGEPVLLVNQIISNKMQKYTGYESLCDMENYLMVFHESYDAIMFCLEVQLELNHSEWPEAVTKHEYAKTLADEELHGLRLQMGVDFGQCEFKVDENKDRRSYFGKSVSRALHISRISEGGQILLSDKVFQALDEKLIAIEMDNEIKETNIKIGYLPKLYEIRSNKLPKRGEYFDKIQADSSKRQAFIKHQESFSPSSPAASSKGPSLLSFPFTTSGSEKSNMGANGSSSSKKTVRFDEDVDDFERMNVRKKKKWELDKADIKMEETTLGSGSFGSVFKGEFKGRQVAIKTLMTAKGQKNGMYISFLSEVSVLSKLSHPNIIEFIGAVTELPDLYIVMEIVEPGSLSGLLSNSAVALTQENKLKIVVGIIEGMHYLHSLNPAILHRDLKAANILVNERFESKICDFGFAKIKIKNRTMTRCGTMAYQAPEILKGERYDEKADVYSFGIIAWEIETRDLPYKNKDPLVLQFEIVGGLRPEMKGGADKTMEEIMKRCWSHNPENRPRFDDLAKQLGSKNSRIEFIETMECV